MADSYLMGQTGVKTEAVTTGTVTLLNAGGTSYTITVPRDKLNNSTYYVINGNINRNANLVHTFFSIYFGLTNSGALYYLSTPNAISVTGRDNGGGVQGFSYVTSISGNVEATEIKFNVIFAADSSGGDLDSYVCSVYQLSTT